MAVYLSPIGNDQQYDSNGAPLVGGYWNAFLAGTSTPVTTYTSNTGGTAQPTNITLNSAGRPSNPIWLTGGVPVKLQLLSASAVVLLTIDNVSGLNDPAGITAQDQWVLYGATPTFVSATSFSVTGDQTGTFQVGRRVKTVNSGGTIYGTITASVFGSVTTVTVVNDSGVIDSGLSAVSYGLLSGTSSSVPWTTQPPQRSYLAGCTLSTAGGSATMSIAAGAATDSTNTYLMQLAATSKTTSAFAPGAGNGGKLSAGAVSNNTWYKWWVIRRADTGVVEVGFDEGATPTLPTNYTQYRYIGSAKTNGSAQWTSFTQNGDEFWLAAPVQTAASTVNPGTASVSHTVETPLGVVTRAILNASLAVSATAATDSIAYIRPLTATDSVPTTSTAPGAQLVATKPASNAVAPSCQLQIMTNTSSQIGARLSASDAQTALYIRTEGWIDTRGQTA